MYNPKGIILEKKQIENVFEKPKTFSILKIYYIYEVKKYIFTLIKFNLPWLH